MKLIPADFISEQDKEMQRVLNEHPDLKYHLTILINSYRERVNACVEEMQEAHIDTADLVRACAKTENMIRRIDIPLLNTVQDWTEARKRYQDAAS